MSLNGKGTDYERPERLISFPQRSHSLAIHQIQCIFWLEQKAVRFWQKRKEEESRTKEENEDEEGLITQHAAC